MAMRVFVLGAGKLGRGLARALKKKGDTVVLRAARKGLPRTKIDADLVVLAVRDRELAPLAARLAASGLVSKRAACVHVAGALDATPLAPLRGVCAGVAQMHPMIAFASLDFTPELAGGHVHVQGDPAAVRRARAVARRLGMTGRTFPRLDTVGYHASAGLVANGAAALAAVGAELLVKSGVPRDVAPKLLGPLLRSVAENVEALGFPAALTGPVRRGELAGLERHLKVLEDRLPSAIPLYLASASAQLPLARTIGEAPAAAFDAIDTFVTRASRRKREAPAPRAPG
jgi:predicted short-subunit dehydrogenase-like oxidoreductase (DUF2520 family)